MNAWPAPVLTMFAGELKADGVLIAADDPNPALKAAHTCEANFYGGQHVLIAEQPRRSHEAVRGGREGMPARVPRRDHGGGGVEGAGREGRIERPRAAD